MVYSGTVRGFIAFIAIYREDGSKSQKIPPTEPVRRRMIAVGSIPPLPATERRIREEIEKYVIEPCIKAGYGRNADLQTLLQEREAVDLMKMMMVETISIDTLPVNRLEEILLKLCEKYSTR